MKFNKEFLQDTCGDKNDVENEVYDTSRWSIHYSRVFKYDGKFYSAPYHVGATEMQEEYPYENDEEEIECPEMEPYQETITRYRIKK